MDKKLKSKISTWFMLVVLITQTLTPVASVFANDTATNTTNSSEITSSTLESTSEATIPAPTGTSAPATSQTQSSSETTVETTAPTSQSEETPAAEEEASAEDEEPARGGLKNTPLESRNLGDIFTFKELTLDGAVITDLNTPIIVEKGTKVGMEFSWNTENLGAKESDTTSMLLPDIFKLVDVNNQDVLVEDGTVVGKYSIKNGQLLITFNENVEKDDVSEGFVLFDFEFDLTKFEDNIRQEIIINDESGVTIPVIMRPSETIEGIDKAGIPNKPKDATEITWTIDVVNTTGEILNNSKVTDVFPTGVGQGKDFKINELKVGLDGKKTVGSLYTAATPSITETGFDVLFEEMAPFSGYRIEYTTPITDYTVTTFTNKATFEYADKKLPAEATVSGIERSDAIEKNGGESNDLGTEITWEITINKNGGTIERATVTDQLPEGLEVIAGSVEIYKNDVKVTTIDTTDFPEQAIELGNIEKDEIYKIKYKTSIDYSVVNSGDYQKNNTFKNHTELFEDGKKLDDAEKEVQVKRPAIITKTGKSNVNYDPATKTLTWTVTVNEAKHSMKDVILTDTIPKGLSIEKENVSVKKADGSAYSGFEVNIAPDPATGATTLKVELGDVGNETLIVTYTTKITDFEQNKFVNKVGITGDGIGEQDSSSETTITPAPNSFDKKYTAIDYNEKMMSWEVTVNPIRDGINNLVITDTFPNNGLILLPDTVKVTLGNSTLEKDKDYTLTPKDSGYQHGFILTMKTVVNNKLTVKYATSFDPQKVVEDNTLLPHIGKEGTVKVYKNKVHFTGTTTNGNSVDDNKEAKKEVIDSSWNNGNKVGQLVHVNEKGEIDKGWVSGSERKIAWEVYTNFLKQDLGEGVMVEDILNYNGEIDSDSVKVSIYDVDKAGKTKITTELDSNKYEKIVEGKKLTIKFKEQVKERYVIEFTTSVPDVSASSYVNNAELTAGGKNYPYTGTVKYDKYNNFLDKKALDITGKQVYTGDEIDWKVAVNESLSIVDKAVITDIISAGHVYVANSLIVTRLGEKEPLEEGADYQLSVTPNQENGTTELKITLSSKLKETLILAYKTVVTETDGNIGNAIKLEGSGIEEKKVESESLTAKQFSSVGGKWSDKRGVLQITKIDSETQTTITESEATFILSFNLNGEKVTFGEYQTTKGILRIGNLPFRTYYLTEKTAPNGYDKSNEEITIVVDTAYNNKEENIKKEDVANARIKTSVVAKKIWDDFSNKHQLRPDAIYVQLYQNNQKYGEVTKIEGKKGQNEWQHVFDELPKTEVFSGKDYVYSVKEVNEKGEVITKLGEYTNSVEDTTITNKLNNVTNINGVKIWDDFENIDQVRPAKITVRLLQNGQLTEELIEVTKEMNWEFEFTDLVKYDSEGNEYSYTISEDKIIGYETSIDGTTITNKYRGKIAISGNKIWDDMANKFNTRPAKIMVRLLQNGVPTDKMVEVTSETDWKYAFTDLVKYDDEGTAYNYTVVEEQVTGYNEPTIVDTTITNKLTKTSLAGIKIWNDLGDRFGLRPDSIVLHLTQNGNRVSAEIVPALVVTKDDNWVYRFENLPKFDPDGEVYAYSVEEDSVNGYEQPSINGGEVTNTLSTTQVLVSKEWDDFENKYGLRPDSISVKLLQNGKEHSEVPAATITPDESGNWHYTFTDLPKYDTEGLEYHYTIEEITVPGYDSNVTSILTEDGDTHQFVLVNSLVTTQVEVTKIWSDFNNQYNLRPDSITVRLIQNGTEIDKMKLTANSDWKGTFVELPLYDSKGKTYDYTILEDEVEGYTTKIVGTTITNTLRSRLPQSGGGSTTTTKPGTKLPQTGDQSNPMLISLAGLAILSLAGTVIVTRRRKSE